MPLVPRPSPNFGPRRDGLRPELVVIHYTAMADADEALARLCAPEHQVSAHYLIARDGTGFQMVAEDMRAWHAGAGRWGGRGDVNSRSIGIELDNCGASPFAAAQMDALENLLAGILARWAIPPQGVIAHSDMAPSRKSDPGPRFDWQRLARAGLSVWPEPAPADHPPADRFRTLALAFGYPEEESDADLLDAFRARFRPGTTGPVEPRDIAMVSDLARRFPIDHGDDSS